MASVVAKPVGPAKRRARVGASRARVTGDGPAAARSRRQADGSRPDTDSRRGKARAAGKQRPARAAVQVGAGVLWALALVGALVASSFLTALLLIPVAVTATASGLRATEARGRSRRSDRRPSLALAVSVGASTLVPLIALAGPMAALAALVISTGVIAALVLASGYAGSARPLRTVGSRLVAALAPVVAVTCLVVARHQGSNLALALVGATMAYDAGAFVMGNARTPLGGAVGVASGVASVAVVAVFVAALMNPPFTGSRPWTVFAAVAVLAPLGVHLCQRAAGPGRLPAMRRLDSLSLVAPMWVMSAALLLHR